MNDKVFVKRWSKTRQKGYLRFMGLRSILASIFGLLGGIFTLFLVYITWDKTAIDSIGLFVGSAIIGATLGGLMVANSTWKASEKRYLNLR